MREFETKPQLQIHKLSIEKELYRVYGSLLTQEYERKEKDETEPLTLLTKEEQDIQNIQKQLKHGIFSSYSKSAMA